MKIISHRGNVSGSDKNRENNPVYIHSLLTNGVDCEIDIWYVEGSYFLGHDYPQYKVTENFISQPGLWCHAKNLESLYKMKESNTINYFWHQNDDFTLTSSNYIWTFPGKEVTKVSIIVDNNEDWKAKKYNCFGVCTDWIYI